MTGIGGDITALIPQRAPIIMVDRLECVEDGKAATSFMVRPDNYFVGAGGQSLAEAGVIEHIAQSASAFSGYKARMAGASDAPVGYIGEVKNFHCWRCPRVNEVLHTVITMGAELEGITVIKGETFVGDELIADVQMKIFVKPQ